MRSFNRISVLVILCSALFVQCGDKEEPVYPIEPHIEFVSVEFVEGRLPFNDSLKLIFTFTDGDNDFGLDLYDPVSSSAPFNLWYFFQENDGALDTLSTSIVEVVNGWYIVLEIDKPEKGKLVFPRTRNKEEYDDLPVYNCSSYSILQQPAYILISAEDAEAIDAYTTIIDTLVFGMSEYYQVADTFLVEINRNHFNIEVDFLVDNGNGFEIFDWHKEFCTTHGFYGRVFANCANTCVAGPFKMKKFNNGSGELTYNMVSFGFKPLFGDKKLKLRVSIKDRALHKSNVIETPEFRLLDI